MAGVVVSINPSADTMVVKITPDAVLKSLNRGRGRKKSLFLKTHSRSAGDLAVAPQSPAEPRRNSVSSLAFGSAMPESPTARRSSVGSLASLTRGSFASESRRSSVGSVAPLDL